MPNLDAWLASRYGRDISPAQRAINAWDRIQDRPAVITIYRNGAPITAQTVRLEPIENQPQEVEGAAGEASIKRQHILGIINHPTRPANSFAKDDTFVIVGDGTYRIINVDFTFPGELQATAERIS